MDEQKQVEAIVKSGSEEEEGQITKGALIDPTVLNGSVFNCHKLKKNGSKNARQVILLTFGVCYNFYMKISCVHAWQAVDSGHTA